MTSKMLALLPLGLLLAGCATAASARDAVSTVAVPTPPPAIEVVHPTATSAPRVVIVMNGARAAAASGDVLAQPAAPVPVVQIPTAVATATATAPTATRVLPTATKVPPTATPKGQTFPPLFPPDLATRTDFRWLPVPYRSQLDGAAYEEANCGPVSLAMVLGAYGKTVASLDVRKVVMRAQRTEGCEECGSFIESLYTASIQYGLKPNGLFAEKGLRKWTLDDLRATLDKGQPVIPQVWYRGLPGRENKPYNGDHYVVIIGYVGDEFIYNDPIDKDAPGYGRRISSAQLDKAWRNSDFPFAGLAIGGPAERPGLTGSAPQQFGVLRPASTPAG